MPKNIIKYIYLIFITAVFMAAFIFPLDSTWENKYKHFNVPAMTYPGGDSRNIQAASYCNSKTSTQLVKETCIETAAPIKKIHPNAVVPPLNYPSVWVFAYSAFGDSSEEFFMRYWTLNAVLLIVTILLLCLKYNYLMLPILLFSPITLLAIERGNNDATTFFFTFIAFILPFNSKPIQALMLGIASSLKIFPIFAFFAFLVSSKNHRTKATLIGCIITVPLMILSFSEIPAIIENTSYGFGVSYGLKTIKHLPFFSNNTNAANAIIVSLGIILTLILASYSKLSALNSITKIDISKLQKNDHIILLMSSTIFLSTFLLSANWSYRLIFIIPALLILSRTETPLAKSGFYNIIFVFIAPLFPTGWVLQNIACIPLFVILGCITIDNVRFMHTKKLQNI